MELQIETFQDESNEAVIVYVKGKAVVIWAHDYSRGDGELPCIEIYNQEDFDIYNEPEQRIEIGG